MNCNILANTRYFRKRFFFWTLFSICVTLCRSQKSINIRCQLVHNEETYSNETVSSKSRMYIAVILFASRNKHWLKLIDKKIKQYIQVCSLLFALKKSFAPFAYSFICSANSSFQFYALLSRLSGIP
jgi:hypothetical protein